MNDMKYYNNRTVRGGLLGRISRDGVAEYFNEQTHSWVADELIADEIKYTGDWDLITAEQAERKTSSSLATA